MARPLVALAVAALLLVPAQAEARGPAVDVVVVGKNDKLLTQADGVIASKPSLKVGSRTCKVAEDTPLAALVSVARPAGLTLRARDYGSCGSSTRNAGGIYVTAVGSDRARGSEGWVYKVGRKVGTAGAGDPEGPFGTGRGLRRGDRVTWFWCRQGDDQTCQPTLDISAKGSSTVTATVKSSGDDGRARSAAGATVTLVDDEGLAIASGTTDSKGRASIPVPAGSPPELYAEATKPGSVRSGKERVRP